jgi:hypothetical protein
MGSYYHLHLHLGLQDLLAQAVQLQVEYLFYSFHIRRENYQRNHNYHKGCMPMDLHNQDLRHKDKDLPLKLFV